MELVFSYEYNRDSIGIWDNGISNLSESLTLNMTLEELDLRNNKIGPQGVQILATSLKHNTSLRRLGKLDQVYK